MKTTPSTRPEAKGKLEMSGTGVGATISLALLVAFGLSSYLNQQDSENRHATEYSNRPTVISAYLA
jgi:hypothetical protein